ncbi:MAG: electron transport complex subunit RsxC [Ignavibacteriae bacterium]|nr:electron transport complex subunit RsxC [Ignavibacteriota bacterium]NOG99953.1 electron transport complex subunit RsxC [Ignavibacteriota bacterium]
MKLFKKAKTFHGGVHPNEYKELTENSAFEIMPNPAQIIVPISQHIGKPAKPLVKKGEEVKAGAVIAEPDGFVSVPIHTSISGKVVKISKESNVSGAPKHAIIIKANEENEVELMPSLNPDTLTPEEIRARVKEAGIVGQGGAAFPTYIKLTPPEDKKIDYVILNGCECEPYLTRDDRFMLERSNDIIAGLKLAMKALGVEKGAVGIEDNKPEAIDVMSVAVQDEPDIEVVKVKTKYPQGAEKMLIKAVLNREVPPGKLPLDVGVVIQNIGTAVAIADAVIKGEPELTAALTVSGLGINNPKNLIVRVGTPLADILEYCGGVKDNAHKVVVGGPMMGVAQFDFAAPVMKATSGILVLTEEEIKAHEETPCLNCGMCVGVCPLKLTPTKLARYAQLDKIDEAEKLGISVCIECGTCAYTCPANIPLVQWIRLGKERVNQLKNDKKSA